MCEFITGGGLCGKALSKNLAKEGALMRDALLSDLYELPLEIVTTIDKREKMNALQTNIHEACRQIAQDENTWDIWVEMIKSCDAVLVIAPETDGILAKFAQLTQQLGKVWLGCSLDAIAVTSNKLKTYAFLKANDIPTPTFTWQQFCDYENKNPNVLFANGGNYVVKPIDGAGCEDTFVFDHIENLTRFMTPEKQKSHLIQLFVEGIPASFVMLCANEKAHLLCCNRQIMQQKSNQLLFKGIEINGLAQHWTIFDTVAQYLASRLPGLQGLVGVDVIVGEKLMSVIEINPRLTTSYVGLRRAMGVNPAQLLLDAVETPNFVMPKIQQKKVTIHV